MHVEADAGIGAVDVALVALRTQWHVPQRMAEIVLGPQVVRDVGQLACHSRTTSPVDPSTRHRSPVRSLVVAESTPMTQGTPSSLATTAA